MGGFCSPLNNIASGCASGKAGKERLHQSGNNQWGLFSTEKQRAESGHCLFSRVRDLFSRNRIGSCWCRRPLATTKFGAFRWELAQEALAHYQ